MRLVEESLPEDISAFIQELQRTKSVLDEEFPDTKCCCNDYSEDSSLATVDDTGTHRLAQPTQPTAPGHSRPLFLCHNQYHGLSNKVHVRSVYVNVLSHSFICLIYTLLMLCRRGIFI